MELPVLQPDADGPRGPGDDPSSSAMLSALLDEIHEQVKAALVYTHHRADTNTEALRDVAGALHALIDLLLVRGVIEKGEFEARRVEFVKQISEQFKQRGMGSIRLVPEIDKYSYTGGAEIDCESRLHVCRAACCRMDFALSKQDIQENVVQWELAHPYVVRHGPEGWCVHCESGSKQCNVYAQRPVACRAYDCRGDDRIWSDFEKMTLAPELAQEYRKLDEASAATGGA